MQPAAEKVTAFVTRTSPRWVELLIFEHPNAGNQLPAGTVEAGEAHAAAVAREAFEETGLSDLPPGRFLTAVDDQLPDDYYLVATTTPVYSRPDPTSFDWASIRRGIMVARQRTAAEFSHITYVERNERADPPYVSYQITGWVPTATITRQVTRYFYHFPYHGETPVTWWAETDNHRFRLFWVPLIPFPPVVASQRQWVELLISSLG